MANFMIMRFKKLKTSNEIKGALKHCFREIPTPNADPNVPNMRFKGMPESSEEAFKKHEEMLPAKFRKDAVRCLEFMVGASEVTALSKEDQNKYFQTALKFIANRCGGRENIIHAEIHLDEKEPHLTLFITPINESGRLGGAKMVGKSPQEVREFQNEFYENVAKQFGLERGEIKDKPRKHEELRDYIANTQKKLNELEDLKKENAELKERLKLYENPSNTNNRRI